TGEHGWHAELFFSPDAFDVEVAQLMARRVAVLLRAAASEPTAPAGSLPVMDAPEREQVLVSFNNTAFAWRTEKCVHQLFEEQAPRTPDRPALRCSEQALSYGELNAQANRLAHLLRRRGIGPNVPVGLFFEPSAEMIAALLAVLKAGGCYVPLIPGN